MYIYVTCVCVCCATLDRAFPLDCLLPLLCDNSGERRLYLNGHRIQFKSCNDSQPWASPEKTSRATISVDDKGNLHLNASEVFINGASLMRCLNSEFNCVGRPDGYVTLSDGQVVFCEAGWALIQWKQSPCATYTQESQVGPGKNCGYLSESIVRRIALATTNVRLKALGEESTSVNSLAIEALRLGTNWHNGAQFSTWQWNFSCKSVCYSEKWPCMFHACGNGNGVHWLVGVYAFPRHNKNSDTTGASSSTWLK
jgi:hypothetical protein